MAISGEEESKEMIYCLLLIGVEDVHIAKEIIFHWIQCRIQMINNSVNWSDNSLIKPPLENKKRNIFIQDENSGKYQKPFMTKDISIEVKLEQVKFN